MIYVQTGHFLRPHKNAGNIDEPPEASIAVMQGGGQVYNETMMVRDPVGNRRTTYNFPSYTPETTGDIMWTATIPDVIRISAQGMMPSFELRNVTNRYTTVSGYFLCHLAEERSAGGATMFTQFAPHRSP